MFLENFKVAHAFVRLYLERVAGSLIRCRTTAFDKAETLLWFDMRRPRRAARGQFEPFTQSAGTAVARRIAVVREAAGHDIKAQGGA
jgi:hypothetical protein